MEHFTNQPNAIRCTAITKRGQCQNKAMDGTDLCEQHGGHNKLRSLNREQVRMYQLGKYQARMQQMTDHPGVLSLRDEIGILRMILEQKFQFCKTEEELIMRSGAISDLVTKIEKLVTGAHKLEKSLGNILDQNQVVTLAMSIVQIVSKYLKDEQLDQVVDEIEEAINKMLNREPTDDSEY